MTAQTVSNAVAKREAGAAELVRQSRDWFRTIVPSHVDANAFVALSIGYLRKNPKLAAAAVRAPQAFTAALSECARLGLVPGDTYHLVPFENTRNDTVDITGITDYKGEIELIYRAGAVASVKAEIVRKRDHFRYTTDMDRPEHAPDWFGDRGDLIGAYAYAVMKDGATSKVIVYSKAEIDEVRAASKGATRSDSPWNTWYDRMALKTVIHRLEHFVPTSAEYRREQLRAAAEVSQQVNLSAPPPAAAPAAHAADVVDAEIVDEPAAEPPKARQRSRSQDRRQQAAAPPEDAPWPGDAAPARPARRADRATGEVIPDDGGDDPRAAVLAAFDALGVAGPEIPAYLTRWSGHKYASPESLSRAAAAWFADRLGKLGSRDELEAVVVAAEARREQDQAAEAGDATGEAPGDGQ